MMYNGAADVPGWLRIGGFPITGTGGLLQRGGASQVGVILLASLALSLLSLLVVLSAQRRRGQIRMS